VLSLIASALSAGLGFWLWQNAEVSVRFGGGIALLSAVLALATVFMSRSAPTAPAPIPVPAPTPTPIPSPALDPIQLADAGALRLLAKLQEQGRLIDFALEDIRAVPDAQVAAVARVVHTGCRAALQSTFSLEPLQTSAEGTQVTLAPGFDAESHRLLGRVAGQPPFTGKLLHRGWRNTGAVKLPHATDPSIPHSGVVAPAEVEIR
jgi:Domain of unknown function (DUF2760)